MWGKPMVYILINVQSDSTAYMNIYIVGICYTVIDDDGTGRLILSTVIYRITQKTKEWHTGEFHT